MLDPLAVLLVLSVDPVPATNEILPQSTPQDTQHPLRRFLRFGIGSRSGHLLRILGVGFGLAVGIGNTIGTGILRTPGEVAGYLGNGWLVFVVWLVGGIYALLCSSAVTELGCMLPRAGGWYVYSGRAFGEKAGFVVGCCDFTVQSVANAYLAVAFAEFVGELLPMLAAFTISVKAGTASLLPRNWFVHPHSIFLGLMLALQGVVVTYDGWYAPIYF